MQEQNYKIKIVNKSTADETLIEGSIFDIRLTDKNGKVTYSPEVGNSQKIVSSTGEYLVTNNNGEIKLEKREDLEGTIKVFVEQKEVNEDYNKEAKNNPVELNIDLNKMDSTGKLDIGQGEAGALSTYENSLQVEFDEKSKTISIVFRNVPKMRMQVKKINTKTADSKSWEKDNGICSVTIDVKQNK